jgi:CTP synthase
MVKVKIVNIAAEEIEEKGAAAALKEADGILVPGGFGSRGHEGKILAIKYAREKKVPFLGICLGMQMAVVEFARNVLCLKNADSTELSPDTSHPVIHLMEEQKKIMNLGGTMRLGAFPCRIRKDTLARKLYDKEQISERHRHRYEFNNTYREQFEQAGMALSGLSPDGMLVEMVEIADHPCFIAGQFHPEFKSRPIEPHPLFRGLIEAALKIKKP